MPNTPATAPIAANPANKRRREKRGIEVSEANRRQGVGGLPYARRLRVHCPTWPGGGARAVQAPGRQHHRKSADVFSPAQERQCRTESACAGFTYETCGMDRE